MQTEFSLSELLANGVTVEAPEAVAVVLRLAPQASAWSFGRFPSLDDVYVTPEGIRLGNVESGEADARSPVMWLASVLHALLAYSESDRPMPLGLQFLVSRACGHRFGHPRQQMEVGAFRPFATVEEFAQALERFSPENPDASIRELHDRALLVECSDN
jgi:hypothetical protein